MTIDETKTIRKTFCAATGRRVFTKKIKSMKPAFKIQSAVRKFAVNKIKSGSGDGRSTTLTHESGGESDQALPYQISRFTFFPMANEFTLKAWLTDFGLLQNSYSTIPFTTLRTAGRFPPTEARRRRGIV